VKVNALGVETPKKSSTSLSLCLMLTRRAIAQSKAGALLCQHVGASARSARSACSLICAAVDQVEMWTEESRHARICEGLTPRNTWRLVSSQPQSCTTCAATAVRQAPSSSAPALTCTTAAPHVSRPTTSSTNTNAQTTCSRASKRRAL